MASRRTCLALGLRALSTFEILAAHPLTQSLKPIAALPGKLNQQEPSPHNGVFALRQQLRSYSSEGLRTEVPEISEHEYHQRADDTMEYITEKIETFVDDLDVDDADVEYSQGVLTVKLGGLGTYVINKQTPNRQIWMSSPVSGPVRYDFYKGSWVYHRDGHKMHERLEKELKLLTGGEIDLNPCASCGKMNACVPGNYCI